MVLEKTKLDDFDSADISMTDMNLQVVSSDDQYCYISYQASDQDNEPISYQVQGLIWIARPQHSAELS